MPKKQANISKTKSIQGAILVFLAIALMVLISFIALVVIASLMFVNRGHLQNIANLAALAGIEEATKDGAPSDFLARAEAVKARVEFIIQQNSLIAFPQSALEGSLGYTPASGELGTLTFGSWYPELPLSGPAPCGTSTSDYPCFVAHPQPSSGEDFPETNAVRLTLRTVGGLAGPFNAIFETAGMNLEVTAIGAVISRCVAFALDASLSTSADSHPWLIASVPGEPSPGSLNQGQSISGYHRNYETGNWGSINAPHCLSSNPQMWARQYPRWVLCPRNLALFAYNDWISVYWPGFGGPTVLDLTNPTAQNRPCRGTVNSQANINYIYTSDPSDEGRIWCNMDIEFLNPGGPGTASNPTTRTRIAPDGSTRNARNFYEYENTPYGRMLIDKVIDPEPLTSFFLGFNAGFRLFDTQKTSSDRARLSIFRGSSEVSPFPEGPYDPAIPDAFVTDFNMMLQLTNTDNRGKIFQGGGQDRPKIYPNFVTKGWFPIYPRGNPDEAGTNIVAAIDSAIEFLSDPKECPASAQRFIVVATDGASSCAPGQSPACQNSYLRYKQAEDRLLKDGSLGLGPSTLTKLKQGKIALTALVAGNQVRPNFVDRKVNGEFLSYAEAVALNHRALTESGGEFFGDPSSDSGLIVDSRPVCDPSTPCDDEIAFSQSQWNPNSFFPRAAGVMAHLAIETGGIYCPLLTPGPQEWYEPDDGDPTTPRKLLENYGGMTLRADGQTLYFNPEYRTTGEQAAECVRRTLNGSPFMLVQP